MLLLRNVRSAILSKWIIKCNIQVRLMLDDWPFGGFMCSIVPFTQSVSVFVSSYTMTAIAIDRYQAGLEYLQNLEILTLKSSSHFQHGNHGFLMGEIWKYSKGKFGSSKFLGVRCKMLKTPPLWKIQWDQCTAVGPLFEDT